MSALHKRGFYEGGKRTVANRDFWNATSSFEEVAQPDRSTMRARARWLHENNAIMSNIDRSIINHTIGNGISMRYTGHTKTANKVITERFNRWIHACDITGRLNFYDFQRTALQSRMVDGEIFIRKLVRNGELKLQFIEADWLDESKGDYVPGITLDEYGAPKTYHFVDNNRHAYDVPADEIINYYRSERPTQYRGVTEYKQAILDIKNFSAFQTAYIESARARANIGYAVETETSPEVFGVTDNHDGDGDVQEIGGVHVQYLKPGEKIVKLDPDNAGADYAHFSESVIRMQATARGVSYELAFKDFSKVNYASSRASLLQDYKRFDYEQRHLVEYFFDKVFAAWLEIEIMAGRAPITVKQYYADPWKFNRGAEWVFPKRDWVDPLKDVNAIAKEIDLGLTTLTDVTASRGGDWETNMQVKAEEQALIDKLNLRDQDNADQNKA